MLKRRYEVNACFIDSDFGDSPLESKRFWSRLSANYYWFNKEQSRRNEAARKTEISPWQWFVVDLSTGQDITPDL